MRDADRACRHGLLYCIICNDEQKTKKTTSTEISKKKVIGKPIGVSSESKPDRVSGSMVMRYPRGVCQKCGDSLAKGSNTYCRPHERERLRKWREKNAVNTRNSQ